MSDDFDDLLAPISERRKRKERESESSARSEFRQSGKRSRSDYAQINANIPKDLKIAVQKELLDRDQTLQDLVEGLLSEWLDAQRN